METIGVLVLIVAVLHFLYLLFFWLRLMLHKDNTDVNTALPPVSVVIAARNEADNLEAFLPVILGQRYPEFEVIVINDRSWDRSRDMLKDMSDTNNKLKIVDLADDDKYARGKKFALFLGFKAAKYEHLLLIDADCYPASENWIAGMMRQYSNATEIVLGYGKYENRKSLLSCFIQFNTFITLVNYGSFAKAKMPYMGVGRNLSYKKDLFFRNKGFSSTISHTSGDDDLFINQVATTSNANLCLSAVTVSNPKESWSQWFTQKRRHISTGKFYKANHKMLLGLGELSFVLLTTSAILLLIFRFHDVASLFTLDTWIKRGILAVFATLIFRWFSLVGLAIKLKDTRLISLMPFYDILHPWLQLMWALANKFQPKPLWK